ncbi:MAG: NAD(P)-dependent oxidoreductase, partial [bacterium]
SNAIVINTGRGPTIDNKALYQALTQQEIAAAGLDDPEEEPAKRSSWDPGQSHLFSSKRSCDPSRCLLF